MEFSFDNPNSQFMSKPQGTRFRRDVSSIPDHERQYICGCGRKYLSSNALFTHAKYKHNGVYPPGTLNGKIARAMGRPRISDAERRIKMELGINPSRYMGSSSSGRDLQDDNLSVSSSQYGYKPPAQSAAQNAFQIDFQQFIADMKAFLLGLPAFDPADPSQVTTGWVFPPKEVPFVPLLEGFLGRIQTAAQERKEQLESGYGQELENAPRTVFESVLNNSREERPSILKTAALFLLYLDALWVRPGPQKLLIIEVMTVLAAMVRFLDERGWDIFEILSTQYKRAPGRFTETMNSEYLPDMMNIFLLRYYKELLDQIESGHPTTGLAFEKGIANTMLLGSGDLQRLRLIVFVKLYCRWLHLYKFTSVKLDVVKESFVSEQK